MAAVRAMGPGRASLVKSEVAGELLPDRLLDPCTPKRHGLSIGEGIDR